MYNTSAAYKEAVKKNIIRSRVSGTITLSNGNVINISDKDIVPGSLSVNNRCINNNDFCFGAVYVGQMSLSLMKEIDRYTLYGAKVELSCFVRLEDGSEEEVPLGVYYVSEPTRTRKTITLKCFDGMTVLDSVIEEDSTGTPHELLSFICEKTGVELENTAEEIMEMCNSNFTLSIYTERVSTYREAVSYISAILAGYATMNRSGKLQICSFRASPVGAIAANRRTKSTIADYKTYHGSVRARFIDEENFAPYVETDSTIENGLLLDMGDIPILYGDADAKHRALANILGVLVKIKYTPADVLMVGDPSIDLGDMLTLENVNMSNDTVNTLVTSYTWKHHAAHSVKSNGANTILYGVSSREAKLISQLQDSVNKKDVVVYTYTNTSDIMVSNTEREIVSFNFSTVAATKPIVLATIPFSMNADGNVVIRYYLDGVLLENETLTKYLSRGNHFLTLSNNLVMAANGRATLKIKMQTDFFESDVRRQDAKIISILDYIANGGEYTERDIDSTVPEAVIKKGTIKAALYAQGLATTTAWDGTLNIAETYFPNAIHNKYTVGRMTENISVVDVPLERIAFAEISHGTDAGASIKVANIEETVSTSIDYVVNPSIEQVFGGIQINNAYRIGTAGISVDITF